MKSKHQWHFQLNKSASYLQLATKTTNNRIADNLRFGNKSKKNASKFLTSQYAAKLINRRLAHYIVLTISNCFLLRTSSVCKRFESLFRLIVFLFMQFFLNNNYLDRTNNKTILQLHGTSSFHVTIERANI